MAESFKPNSFNASEINGGNRYENGQVLSAETVNKTVEAALYAQNKADEAKSTADTAVATVESLRYETWTFTLSGSSGGTVTKKVCVKNG